MENLKIAVVGSGISGLSASWLLSKQHNVTLFEAGDYPGGHANTIDALTPDGPVPVDTGFIVYNEPNYPNLTALFSHLDVATRQTEMSFALTRDQGSFEYSGSGANGYFGQRSNFFRPRHWHLLSEILRFFRTARDRMRHYPFSTSLGEFLLGERYSTSFISDHIMPMGAAIWSTTLDGMLEFPAHGFVEFYANHGLLDYDGRPIWRTVSGGSREYVAKMVEDGNFSIQLNTPIKRVVRHPKFVYIVDHNGVVRPFDHVVIAGHADQALAMLDSPDELESDVLGTFRYQQNRAVLHSDPRWMPKRRHLWSCWNYLKESESGNSNVCLTYWLNELQGLDSRTNLFLTLNPNGEIHPKAVKATFDYDHPVFCATALEAQKKLWNLQGRNRTWFCGSYFGFGFHEDGAQSGLAVAEMLGGIRRPWIVENESGRINHEPVVSVEAAE
jgi:predicted NAD/FAD-binding protein